MNNPDVSICIPVYNAEKYIKETIESILNQTYKDFELIIIDNNSTDNTFNIINSFEDERIKVFKNETNLGMVGNWNECLKKSSCQYIQFVCSDDILYKECIEEKVRALKSNDNIVMVVCNTDIINSDGKRIFTRRFTLRKKTIKGEKIAIKSFRRRTLFGEPSNVLFRNIWKEKVGLFNEKLSYTPDWEYWLRLAKHGDVVYLGKSLAKFRVLPTSGTAYLLSKTSIMREDDHTFIKSIKEEYGDKISNFDILSHKIIGTLRLYSKWLFVRIFAKRGD